jgi:hypothetical protein
MAALHESLGQFLAAHRDKNYCAECLAQAASSPSGQGRTPVAQLMWTVYRALPDRIVERGLCAGCGKTGLILRYTGK